MMHKSFGLQQAAAARLGLTQATVSRDLSLNGISALLLDQVRFSRIGDNAAQLRALARLDHKRQERVLALIDDGAARNVAGAIAIIEKRVVPDAETKRLTTFLDTFARMGRTEKAKALHALAGALPSGWALKEVKERERLPTNTELRAMVEGEGK